MNVTTTLHSKGETKSRRTSGTLWERDLFPGVKGELAVGAEGFQLPPLSNLRPMHSRFADFVIRGSKSRFQRSLNEVLSAADDYAALCHRVGSQFKPLLTSYDYEQVLSATCALSFLKPSHFDIDEMGQLGKDRKWTFPDEIVRALIENIVSSAKGLDIDQNHYSMTRGTNTGWFSPVSRRSRSVSDLLLAVHCGLAIEGKKRGMSLEDLTQELETIFGPRFAYAGERLQHHAKPHLLVAQGSHLVSFNLEPRSRSIYMSPKFMVAYNREWIKPVLRAVLASVYHTQDRQSIAQRISSMKKIGWVIALDCSKFDQNHGGVIGKQLISIAADIASRIVGGDKGVIEANLLTEFTCPSFVKSEKGCYISKGGEILSSGVSMTSIVNCLASQGIVYYLASRILKVSPSSLDSMRGVDWDALTFGDDMVFCIKKNLFSTQDNFETAIAALGEEIQLTFTAEPTIKFLGQNYDMLSYAPAPTSYPVGRFIQQQFFPERKKNFPFNEIGYIARLQLVDESVRKDLHSFMRPFFPSLGITPFDLSKASDRLKELLPLVEKYSQEISQMDDILGVLTHGIEVEDLAAADIDIDIELSDLLAQARIDMSDWERKAFECPDVGVSPSEITKSVKRFEFGKLRKLLTHVKGASFDSGVSLLGPIF